MKSATANLMENLARQYGRSGITVNTVAPGLIATDSTAGQLANEDTLRALLDEIPLRSVGRPEDCVGAVVLMCSEAGRYITGTTVFVDGGMHLPGRAAVHRRRWTDRPVSRPRPAHVVDRTAITTPIRADGAASGSAAGEVFALDAVAGESPVWLASRGIVASVDAVGGTVHLLHLEDAVDEVVALPRAASACVALTDDTLLLATGRQFDILDLATGAVSGAVDRPGEPPPGADLNDAVLDRRGRIWTGARPSRDDGDRGVLSHGPVARSRSWPSMGCGAQRAGVECGR